MYAHVRSNVFKQDVVARVWVATHSQSWAARWHARPPGHLPHAVWAGCQLYEVLMTWPVPYTEMPVCGSISQVLLLVAVNWAAVMPPKYARAAVAQHQLGRQPESALMRRSETTPIERRSAEGVSGVTQTLRKGSIWESRHMFGNRVTCHSKIGSETKTSVINKNTCIAEFW